MVQQPIKQVIAHIYPCGVREFAGNPLFPHCIHNPPHRNGRKISRGAICFYRLTLRHESCIIRYAGVPQIQGRHLRRHLAAPSGLTNTEDYIRPHLLRPFKHSPNRTSEQDGHLHFHQPKFADHLRKPSHCFP